MIPVDVSAIKNVAGGEKRLVIEADLPPVVEGPDLVSFKAPPVIEIKLVNTGGSINVTGLLQGKAGVVCSRCLDVIDIPVTVEIHETYYNRQQPGLKPDADWLPYQGDTVDIMPEVIRAIIAALPMKNLCREDCKGLCQHCGCNLNIEECKCSGEEIDQRLAVLKTLLDDNRDISKKSGGGR